MYTCLIYPNIEKRIICDREYFEKKVFSSEFSSELCTIEACIDDALKKHLTSIAVFIDNPPERMKSIWMEIFEFFDGNGFWYTYNNNGYITRMHFDP